MKTTLRRSLLARVTTVFAASALAFSVLAQQPAADPHASNQVHVETGALDGAPYRIDMPAKWNRILVIYYHGYSEAPAHFDKSKPDPIGSGFASAGFAVAQSGYSTTGWAMEQAMADTEALRQHFLAHYGQPSETYVTGHSMGGILTAATIESYPNRYNGALALCGLLEPTTWAMDRAGAMLAAFHFYYPGLIPGPAHIPASVRFDGKMVDTVRAALGSNPKGHAEMLALGHFKNDNDLASGIVFSSYVERDLEQKIGATVLNNANFIYAGGPDDNALNDGVRRYTASTAALDYLKTWYTPTGVLDRPMLAVHTTYDPIIPAETVSLYADQVLRAGSSRFFVQQYVKADGHCNINGEQTLIAMQELLAWVHFGKKPSPGQVPTQTPKP